MVCFGLLRFSAGVGDVPALLWIVTWPETRLFQESF
jgi:hypothetical protein